ncbi:unnamed protein product [Parnassius mnemosyne]|uniref:Uncharacterized protein n=1 Tax=Parnassius mnemosyne TaxID=213953 RepID=A0AAV1M710_9NEOP
MCCQHSGRYLCQGEDRFAEPHHSRSSTVAAPAPSTVALQVGLPQQTTKDTHFIEIILKCPATSRRLDMPRGVARRITTQRCFVGGRSVQEQCAASDFKIAPHDVAMCLTAARCAVWNHWPL